MRIGVEFKGDKAIVSAYNRYAAIQQFGGYAGRHRKTKIPARPFLSLTRGNLSSIENYLFS